jgi:hypothetical protein
MTGVERALEPAEGTAAEVDQDMCLGLVHRQREAEAADAAAAVERLRQRLAEGDRRILEAVMGVDLEIALQAMVSEKPPCAATWSSIWSKKAKAGVDPPRLGAVEVDCDRDLRLLGLAHQLGAAAIRRLGCQAEHGEQGRLLDLGADADPDPAGAAWGRKRARMPALPQSGSKGFGILHSRKRKLPPPLRTLSCRVPCREGPPAARDPP